MTYYLFRLAIKIVPLLPDWFIQLIGYVAGWIAWLVAIKAREQATQNMLYVLGSDVLDTPAGQRNLHCTVQTIFRHSVLNYLTIFSLPARRPERILAEIHIDGIEHFEAALARGKGVILFATHMGPFDYIMQWVALSGYDATVPMERLKDPRMLELITGLRSHYGMHMLPVEGGASMRVIFQKLRANKVVVLAVDRPVEGQSSEEMLFFGAKARLPGGVAHLAKRTGATVVGAFGRRSTGGKIYGQFVPLSLALTEEQRTDPDEVQRNVVVQMEQQIRAHPEQWVAALTPIWAERPPVKGV